MIVILQPNWRKINRTDVGYMSSTEVPLYPIELFYIKKNLDKINRDNKLIDLWKDDKDFSDIAEDLKYADEIVILSAPFYPYWRDGIKNPNFVNRCVEEIRKISSAKIIVIGPHGTVLPDTVLGDVFPGEPEYYFNTKPGEYGYISNLDTLESDFSQDYPHANLPLEPVLRPFYYESSRGCPYHCIFCNRIGFRKDYRERSLDRIRYDAERMRDAGIDYVFLIDENFSVSEERTLQIAQIFKDFNILWGCQMRPKSLTNTEYLDKLYALGMRYCFVGLESANTEVLKTIGKEKFDLSAFRYNVRKYDNRIAFLISCIFGSPNETESTISETVKYIRSVGITPSTRFSCSPMMAYPKTKLGESIKSWSDMEAYEGIIGNRFSSGRIRELSYNFKAYESGKAYSKKKTILIATPVKNPYPEYFESVLSLNEIDTCEILMYCYEDELKTINQMEAFLEKYPQIRFVKIPRPQIDMSKRRTSFKLPNSCKTEKELFYISVLRNHAIKVARKYKYEKLFFIDSDVLVPPDTIEKIKDFSGISGGWYYLKHLSFPPIGDKSHQDKILLGETIKTPWVPGGCMMIDSSVFSKIRFSEYGHSGFCEDGDYCIRSAYHGFSTVCCGSLKCEHLTIV